MGKSGNLVLSLVSLLQLTVLAAAYRIDTHTHFVPPIYRTLLTAANISAGYNVPDWNVSAHIAFNEQSGIKTSVVSVSTPGATISANYPVDQVQALARQINEYGYNLTIDYPGKFLFFASLTLPDINGSVAEAIYALDTLGAAGVIVYASEFGELFGTPRYAPLYKVLDDRCAVVFIHPSDSPCAEPTNATLAATGIPPYVVDFLLDTTRAALNLVYRNVTRDYPNIKFILAHSGGFLPFAGLRAASILGVTLDGQAAFLEMERANFHADLAVSATPYALPSTLAFFNKTQITFGTDFPYAPLLFVEQNIANYQAYKLGNSARRKFDFGNAHGLFKKFLKY